jgi:hypothetical protein
MTEKQILGFNPAPRLEHIAISLPSACRIANIALNDAMILSHDENPDRMGFSERTGLHQLGNSPPIGRLARPHIGRSQRRAVQVALIVVLQCAL